MLKVKFLITEKAYTSNIFDYRIFIKLSYFFYFIGLLHIAVSIVKNPGMAGYFDWQVTQYYVNYFDLYFVKRALVGTLLYPIVSMVGSSVVSVKYFMIIIDIFVFYFLLRLIGDILKKNFAGNKKLIYSVTLILIASPVGFMQFGYDVARLDHINILLCICIFNLLLERQILFAGTLSAIGVLVHEAFFIYAFPVFISYVIFLRKDLHFNNGLDRWRIYYFSALSFIISVMIFIYGNSDINFDALFPIGSTYGKEVWNRALVEPSFGLGVFQYVLICFYATMPYVFLVYLYRSSSFNVDLMFFSSFAPLCLFFLGVDYSRWCQLILFSVILVVLFKIENEKIIELKKSMPINILFLIYIMPLGPIGVSEPLPYLAKLIKFLF